MHDAAPTGYGEPTEYGRPVGLFVKLRLTAQHLRQLASRCMTSRSVQQTAQRVGIALVVALLWQLTSCSRSSAPNTPADPQAPAHSSGHAGMAGPATATAANWSPSAGGHLPGSTGAGANPGGTPAALGPPQSWTAEAAAHHCTAPPLIAHRGQGASMSALPENTSAAELSAAHQGATLLNVDVRWTSDDVPVALHDPTLNRTTTGSGPVNAITAAQFQALSLKTNDSRQVLGGRHPETLAQLLATAKGTGLPIVIQMEADPFSGGAGQASINALAAVIAASGYGGEVVVGGWAADDVRAFSTTAPGIRTAFIQESGNPTAASIRATGARILYIDYAQLTAAQVTAWHAGGLAVWAWTPAYPDQWTRLRTLGVDAIATNWLASYTSWARPCPAVLPSV
jgi:glycerophosphoryl diester phosphodiesterase